MLKQVFKLACLFCRQHVLPQVIVFLSRFHLDSMLELRYSAARLRSYSIELLGEPFYRALAPISFHFIHVALCMKSRLIIDH